MSCRADLFYEARISELVLVVGAYIQQCVMGIACVRFVTPSTRRTVTWRGWKFGEASYPPLGFMDDGSFSTARVSQR